MSKFCPNCGNKIEENEMFCGKCGKKINGSEENNSINVTYQNNNYRKIENRNIALAVVFSFLTCGIYLIYWFIKITDEAKELSGSDCASGGLAFLYTLLTCGIYGIYWNYKVGQNLYEAGVKYNKNIKDNSILYLILGIFGLGIIDYCIMQNDLNEFSK